MNNTLAIIQIIVSILLIITILFQQKGTALGSAFGGGGVSYSKKRGIEKTIFSASVVLAALFIILSIINIIF
jgi:preprotein translocase subunit SecG